MGTSSSSRGPGGNSPLIPPWADSEPNSPQPEPEAQRFRGFRTHLGQFVSGGGSDQTKLRSALGNYARKATGGGTIGPRRFGVVASVGGALFDAMAALRDGQDTGLPGIDLGKINGLPTDVVIGMLVQALIPVNGDAERIRVALNDALSEALVGQEEFDFNSITDDVMADMMVAYLCEAIFEQIILDSCDAFAKAQDTGQADRAEKAMHALVYAAADKHMAPLLAGNIRTLNGRMVRDAQMRAIKDIWAEWEEYVS